MPATPPNTPRTTAPTPTPTLREGAEGPPVARLQRALKSLGFRVSDDGIFGPRTARAVRAFQTKHALIPDGIVGPKTWAALTAAITAKLPPTDRDPNALPERRVYPLRALEDGRKPVITSRHKARNPSRKNHNGVDLFFRYDDNVDPDKKIGDSGRTERWWVPEDTTAIAAAAGKVTYASWTPTGMRVWLLHDNGWRTGYFHLDRLYVAVGDEVELGTPLGRVSDNPRDRDPDHLHWELYRGDLDDYPAGTVDPELFLKGARVLDAA